MQVAIQAKCWDGQRQKVLTTEMMGPSYKSELQMIRRLEYKMKYALGYTVPIVLAANFIPLNKASAHGLDESVTAAAMNGAVKERILHAFDPLIDLAISLSYPIAGVMIAGGCLFVMVGNRERGMSMLQNAAIGYILVQLSPLFLRLLVGVGSTVS